MISLLDLLLIFLAFLIAGGWIVEGPVGRWLLYINWRSRR